MKDQNALFECPQCGSKIKVSLQSLDSSDERSKEIKRVKKEILELLDVFVKKRARLSVLSEFRSLGKDISILEDSIEELKRSGDIYEPEKDVIQKI